MNMNTVIITGIICYDPVYKKIGEQKTVCEFKINIVSSGENKKPNFLNSYIECDAWNKKAKYMYDNHFKKDDFVVIEGKLDSHQYIDANGNKTNKTKIIVIQIRKCIVLEKERTEIPEPENDNFEKETEGDIEI